jgi:hypothetical protein
VYNVVFYELMRKVTRAKIRVRIEEKGNIVLNRKEDVGVS